MTKKICATILTVMVLLYAVSMGVVLKFGLDAKFDEFWNRDTKDTYYDFDYYNKALTEGKITFQDAVNSLCEYDLLINDIPIAALNVVFDAQGNVLSESKTLLKLNESGGNYNEMKYFIDLEYYLTDDILERILEIIDGRTNIGNFIDNFIDEVECYKEGDYVTPVALTFDWVEEKDDSFETVRERIVLNNLTPNAVYDDVGEKDGWFEVFTHRLDGKMDKIHEYLERFAAGFCQLAKDGEYDSLSLSGNRRGEPYPFTELSYSVNPIELNGQTYYFINIEATNCLQAVFEDESYIKGFVAITVVYALLGTFLCFYGVKLYNKKEEDEKYKDKYTGIV